MEYLSSATKQLINLVIEVASTIGFELGSCLAKPDNGDMAWFLFTDAPNWLCNMYVLAITPHGAFGEYNFDEIRHYSAIYDVAEFLEFLYLCGYRKLTDNEMKYFTDS